jgi:hypothetical protein
MSWDDFIVYYVYLQPAHLQHFLTEPHSRMLYPAREIPWILWFKGKSLEL